MPESSRPRTRSITGNRAGRWVVALVILLAVGVGGWLWRWRQVAPESEITKPYHQAPDQAQRAPSESLPTDVHPLDPALDFARQVRDRMIRDIHDYTAKIIKRERIKGKLGSEDYMQVKIRHADFAAQPPIPFSVFLRNVEPSSAAGREVIWIRGQNDDKLLTHQFGLTLKLPTDGMLAMMGNKYPITDIGMLKLAEKLIEKGERDRQLGPCQVEFFENQLVAERHCKLIQITHPEPKPGLDYHLAQIFIDNQWGVPIRFAAYIWPPQPGEPPELEEEYTYLNVELNVGLTDEDFSTANVNYGFPK